MKKENQEGKLVQLQPQLSNKEWKLIYAYRALLTEDKDPQLEETIAYKYLQDKNLLAGLAELILDSMVFAEFSHKRNLNQLYGHVWQMVVKSKEWREGEVGDWHRRMLSFMELNERLLDSIVILHSMGFYKKAGKLMNMGRILNHGFITE